MLVFGASLVLLAVGLAFIYFPVTRHPGIVLALGLAVLAGSLVKPEAALLLAQASSLGVVLTIVAALLARRALRRPVQPLPPRGSSRAVLDRSITEAYYRAAKGTQSSTATAPVAMKVGPPENES